VRSLIYVKRRSPGGREHRNMGHMEKFVRTRLRRDGAEDVTVLLESADAFEPRVLELLRDLSARTGRCTLRLVGEGEKARPA